MRIKSLNAYCIRGKYWNSDDGSYCARWCLLSNFMRCLDTFKAPEYLEPLFIKFSDELAPRFECLGVI